MINKINPNTNYLINTNNNFINKKAIKNKGFEEVLTKNNIDNMEDEIKIKSIDANNKETETIFRKFGLSSLYNIGDNIHLYDISNFIDEFDFELENNEILSFINEAGTQQFRCRFNYPNGGKVISANIHLPNYSTDIPMDEKTFEDNIIKGFKAICEMLSTQNKLGDEQLDSYGISISYNETNKSLDTEDFSKSLLNSINRRTLHKFTLDYNGSMNLMVDKLQLMKSIKNLEDFLNELFKKK